MTCAQCGSPRPAGSDRCPTCEGRTSATRFDAATIANGRPDLVSSASDATLPISSEEEAATMFVDPALTMLPSENLDETRLGSNPALDAVTIAPQLRTAQSSRDIGPLSVGQNFGARYHIIRPLGTGGMGAVYQAWDSELEVAVAIKVIRPETMADPEMAAEVERRFKRELLLARQVTHRNVVRIHDLGDVDGIKYITMSYIDGTELGALLRRDGALPVPQVLRIAKSVASGLAAAHAVGVVHRDLKPPNIMLDKDGEAVIMDFGIARSTGDVTASTASGVALPHGVPRTTTTPAMTLDGVIVGTIEYMAPEQARGGPVDQRADIYALGLILYDSLVGRRRTSHDKSAVAELKGRMSAAPPPLKTVASGIPDAVDQVVSRCLDPDPEKRYASTADLLAELEGLDENGVPLPVRRVVRLPIVAAVVALLLAGIAGTWWYSRTLVPPPAHEPMSVLIADVGNTTGDAEFDHTLEPMIRLALEEAGFISAIDRTQMRGRLGVPAPDALDERAATEIATKQGVGVVLSGAIARQGTDYTLTIKASETVTGNVLATGKRRARSRDQVLAAATALAIDVRKALGDDTSDSTRRFAADTLSTTSIDVVRDYAVAMQALADGKFDDALSGFQRAVQRDPQFGLAYVGMASSSRNMDRVADAEKYAQEAVRHLDRMTERERYRARGLVYMATGDYPQCLKEFSDMLSRYAADVVAYNNLAFCQTQLRHMPDAVNAVKRATEILPKRALYRLNLALYSAYASDFTAAETEAMATRELGNALGLQPLAYAQVAQGKMAEAQKTYRTLMDANPQGATIAASGLADLAIYEGRFADAITLYQRGAAADLERQNKDRAAAKFAAMAYAQLLRGRNDAARAAAAQALETSQSIRVRLLAGRVLAITGDTPRAQAVADALSKELQTEAQAAGKVIAGDIALRAANYAAAIKALTEANDLVDTWIGQFDLGRAYLAAGRFTQADSAFDRCLHRRGELFLDEEPTYGYLPSVYYEQGRTREAQRSVGFADLYQQYLAARQAAGEDPLLPEIRKRISSNQ
jgi:eukaryotic-like serine/threonine-protein kinase